jgi:hypothetical protein
LIGYNLVGFNEKSVFAFCVCYSIFPFVFMLDLSYQFPCRLILALLAAISFSLVVGCMSFTVCSWLGGSQFEGITVFGSHRFLASRPVAFPDRIHFQAWLLIFLIDSPPRFHWFLFSARSHHRSQGAPAIPSVL